MLALPNFTEGRGNIKIAKRDFVVNRDFDLQVVSRRERDGLIGVDRFEHEFFDERRDALIADDPEPIGLLRAGTVASGVGDV